MSGDNWIGPREIAVPAYTSSIDAAMTLVPEGNGKDFTDLYGVARASVGINANPARSTEHTRVGSLAIALCIAALAPVPPRNLTSRRRFWWITRPQIESALPHYFNARRNQFVGDLRWFAAATDEQVNEEKSASRRLLLSDTGNLHSFMWRHIDSRLLHSGK